MPTLHECIETALPIQDAFDYVADFSNAASWDPGVATSVRLDSGPVREGTRIRLGVRIAGRVEPMDYVVTTWQPPTRVVLTGSGSRVTATDDIRFETTPTGTRVDYTADIRLRGFFRFAAPFTGGTFERIARDARDGMQRALDRRAAAD